MSGINRYGSRDATFLTQRIRGAVRAIRRETAPIRPFGLYAYTDASSILDTAAIATLGNLQQFLDIAIPDTVPSAPTIISLTAGDSSISVSFTEPEFNGAQPATGTGTSIINYEYSVDSGETWEPINSPSVVSPLLITGLTNGTSYTVLIRAVNAVGSGPASNSLSATPVSVPDSPQSVSANGGDREATVSFSAPASDGGSAVLDYTVSSSPDNITATGSESPITVTGLTNGTVYTFTVTARNAIGNSSPSDASNEVTPAPSIPLGSIYLAHDTLTNVSIVEQSPFIAGGYSYDFEGNPSYLTIPGDDSWAFGTGDFTIEWFQYETDNNPFTRIFTIGAYGSGGASIACSIESEQFYAWLEGGSNNFGELTDYKNRWVHFAIVRKAGVLSAYRDGVAIGNLANTANITDNTTTLYFGVEDAGVDARTQFNGYITNFRIVKGLAVYSGDFTVPTSDLQLIAGANPYGGSNTMAIPDAFTKLLFVPVPLPPEQLLIDPSNLASYSGSGNTVSSIGTSTVSGNKTAAVTLVSDATAGQVFNFSGSGSNIAFGNFDFGPKLTVMAWVNPTLKNNINALIGNEAAGNNVSLDGFKLGWNWFDSSSDSRRLIFEGKGGGANNGPAIIQYSTWQMIVYVLDTVENTVSFFYNGNQAGSTSSLPVGLNMNTAKGFRIGSFSDGNYTMRALLGELRTYPDALTADQVLLVFNETKGRYGL